MKNKRILIALISFVVLASIVVGGIIFMNDRKQKSKYAAQREMKTHLENVCNSVGIADATPYSEISGIHPLEYAKETAMGYLVDRDYYTPLTWKPSTLGEAELVACIVEEDVELEQCSYELDTGSRGVLIRIQRQIVVTLRDAKTGGVVATSDLMMGDLPRECQVSEEFKAGELTQYVAGTRPGDAVDEWLKPYVEVP